MFPPIIHCFLEPCGPFVTRRAGFWRKLCQDCLPKCPSRDQSFAFAATLHGMKSWTSLLWPPPQPLLISFWSKLRGLLSLTNASSFLPLLLPARAETPATELLEFSAVSRSCSTAWRTLFLLTPFPPSWCGATRNRTIRIQRGVSRSCSTAYNASSFLTLLPPARAEPPATKLLLLFPVGHRPGLTYPFATARFSLAFMLYL